MADHLQTKKSMLARGLNAFNGKVIWMAVNSEDGAIAALQNHMCTLLNKIVTHTEYLLTAQKSWKTQMSLLSK